MRIPIRTKRLYIRVTEGEWDTVRGLAEKRGVSITEILIKPFRLRAKPKDTRVKKAVKRKDKATAKQKRKDARSKDSKTVLNRLIGRNG